MSSILDFSQENSLCNEKIICRKNIYLSDQKCWSWEAKHLQPKTRNSFSKFIWNFSPQSQFNFLLCIKSSGWCRNEFSLEADTLFLLLLLASIHMIVTCILAKLRSHWLARLHPLIRNSTLSSHSKSKTLARDWRFNRRCMETPLATTTTQILCSCNQQIKDCQSQ